MESTNVNVFQRDDFAGNEPVRVHVTNTPKPALEVLETLSLSL